MYDEFRPRMLFFSDFTDLKMSNCPVLEEMVLV